VRTLAATATASSARLISVLAAGGTLDVSGNSVLTLSGILSGSGALSKIDSGMVKLDGQ